jgi:hypothetical protein
MPRGKPARLDRPIKVTINIPESVYSRFQLALWSELEGRVPYGKLSEVVSDLIVRWLDGESLDLRPFGIYGTVFGGTGSLHELKTMLEDFQRQEKEK